MPNNAPTSSVFLKTPSDTKGIPVRRTVYRCSGISCCEYSDSTVRLPHTSWTIKDWEKKKTNIREAELAFMEEWNPWIGQEETLV
jgi:hypothetical protein